MWHCTFVVNPGQALRFSYKGIGLAYATIDDGDKWRETFFWNIPSPPPLDWSRCYSLPIANTYTTLADFLASPLRMKVFQLPRGRKTITAVFCFGLFDFHISCDDAQDLAQFCTKASSMLAPFNTRDAIWLAATIDHGEDIYEVAVHNVIHGLATSLTLSTSRGRKIYLGPVERQPCNTTYLVGEPGKVVKSIIIREPQHVDHQLRIGVDYDTAEPPMHVHPVTGQSLMLSERPIEGEGTTGYHSRIDVSKYDSFQFCIDPTHDDCIGIYFHGDGGHDLLGQWRGDFNISENFPLPTSKALENVEGFVAFQKGNRHVSVCELTRNKTTKLVDICGSLEWWAWNDGSKVFGFP
ncbi:hypothetical protein K431DRAFT_348078 [Polychaeton citri CBS 116435]|uniref:Uncharacterized protein n=1 Tax=Polychaeton citri CBS 116435 TaxID=1314669 RepID=A0A9P4Q2C4_9PEZI|nr:hypothetical protein K431DRAFT_348078 [Polychaeton citri CBS 116435]